MLRHNQWNVSFALESSKLQFAALFLATKPFLRLHLYCRISEVTDGGVDKIPAPLFGGLSATMKDLLADLEGVREVRDNETPKGLRKFAIFLICVTPIMLAPFWSHFCASANGGTVDTVYTVTSDGTLVPLGAGGGEVGEDGAEVVASVAHPFGCVAGYFIAILYVIITFSLLRVQEALEDPFDGMGEDDIQWQNFARHLDEVDLYGENGVELRKEAAKELIGAESYQGGGVVGKDD